LAIKDSTTLSFFAYTEKLNAFATRNSRRSSISGAQRCPLEILPPGEYPLLSDRVRSTG